MSGEHQGSGRTLDRLREHYVIERELSDRLRRASREERGHLYAETYDELFRRVPDHPMLVRKVSEAAKETAVQAQMAMMAPFISPSTTYLEIGAGDCALALAMARRVRRVIAVDVSEGITSGFETPEGFSLVITDGVSIPADPGSVDLAYSNQVLEHLHVDDALIQLQNIHRSLAEGGRYVCATPNRLLGPHDISRYFDEEATGFHMKEYTTTEMHHLFREAGFSQVRAIVGARGRLIQMPVEPIAVVEWLLALVAAGHRRRIANTPALRWMLGGRIVATR